VAACGPSAPAAGSATDAGAADGTSPAAAAVGDSAQQSAPVSTATAQTVVVAQNESVAGRPGVTKDSETDGSGVTGATVATGSGTDVTAEALARQTLSRM